MRRLVLLLVALVFGCDDPAVSAKALDVLEHGFVSAEMVCECGQRGWKLYRLIDGACLADHGYTRLYPRSDSMANTCLIPGGVTEFSDGELHFASAPTLVEASTCCTGFNFEAFEFGAE